jgi:uncharacterized protein YyaL (SSP411 family)
LKKKIKNSVAYNLSFFWFFLSLSTVLFAQNNLINEGSLYLRQHASNPIDWNPWNKDILNLAQEKNKLIVISVGYSSCHWCHVMEDETFQDSKVAEYMNKHFISIKVDREERPDLDAQYMKYLKLISGTEGWPLNVIALPDGKVIWAGTYLDKDAWLITIQRLHELYSIRKNELLAHAVKIQNGVSENIIGDYPGGQAKITKDTVKKVIQTINQNFDESYGGFGNDEKFLVPFALQTLLRYAVSDSDQYLNEIIKKTVENISSGGIKDHIGGGFHRYTTDRNWKTPHYEKMLYDNAQMLALFSLLYSESKNDEYKKEAYALFSFLERNLLHESGLYKSSISAVSLDEYGMMNQGLYYTWSMSELRQILGDDYDWVAAYYGLNFDEMLENNRFIFQRKSSDSLFLKSLGWSETKLLSKLERVRKALLKNRNMRKAPIIDNKIIFSWNAIAVVGLIEAYKAFGDKRFFLKAEKMIKILVSEKYVSGNQIKHTNNAKEIVLFLEDYAFTIRALINFYQISGDEEILSIAENFTRYALQTFSTDNNILFHLSFEKNDSLQKFVQLKDNFLPSGNSVMCDNLFRLSHHSGNLKYKERAQKMIKLIEKEIFSTPMKYISWLDAYCNFTLPFYEIVINGRMAFEFLESLHKYYLPNAVVAASKSSSELFMLKDRYAQDETLIYLCEDNICKQPVNTITDLMNLIKMTKKPSKLPFIK